MLSRTVSADRGCYSRFAPTGNPIRASSAVVDNADDLSWDVSGVVPKSKAGTVIVTSQDAQALRLLGGRTPAVRDDAMEPGEAVRLVSNCLDEHLWRGNVAMKLVGARVRADVRNGDDLATALRQYISDYKRGQDRLSDRRHLPCGDDSRRYVENPDSDFPLHCKE